MSAEHNLYGSDLAGNAFCLCYFRRS